MDNKQILHLQNLAKQVKEYACDPINEKHKQIWYAVNDLKMLQPAILARDYPSYLINFQGELTTTIDDPFFKKVELDLLTRIYEWRHMRCHRVINPIVKCPVFITDSKYGIDVSSPDGSDLIDHQEIKTSVHFSRIISSDHESDLEKITYPTIKYDEEKTMQYLSLMNEIFSDILDVKLYGIDFFHFAPWDDLLSWMGIEDGLYDLMENPEFMTKAIKRYVDISIHRAKQYESLGLVSSNNDNTLVGSGGYGYTSYLPDPTSTGINGKLLNNWGDGTDQIFTSVSPQMTEDFAVRFEKVWTDLFGLNYYGCCERLDHKINQVRGLTRLRKISMSPYANIEAAMEQLSNSDIVISFKPNSNFLAIDPWDKEALRNELIKVCGFARKHKVNVEIIMKTIITLCNDPTRLWEWCDMAADIVNNY